MNKLIKIAVPIVFALIAATASARTIQIPENKPVIALDIPDSWEPEMTDRGVGAEDPDGVVTVYFEVAASEKQLDRLIDESMTWLTEEHKLKIKGQSKRESSMNVGGVKSSTIYFDANSKEHGPAKVGFVFTPMANRLLVTTFWVSADEFDNKLDRVLMKIFNSVRSLR